MEVERQPFSVEFEPYLVEIERQSFTVEFERPLFLITSEVRPEHQLIQIEAAWDRSALLQRV